MTPRAPGAEGGGVAFPPTTPDDIDRYDPIAVIDGYLSYQVGDPEPGPNRSPGFRWGWTNRRRDGHREDDGHDAVRHAYIAARPAKAATPPTEFAARPGHEEGCEP